MPALSSLFRRLSLGVALMLPAFPAAAKAPFRVIYNNDTVNVTECTSPWHGKGEPFREEMLKASIDEAVDAGVDAYFLQPGLTAVPFWKSAIYPPAEHFRWWQETFQGKLHEFGTYLLGGGDVVAVFVEHCRSRHVAPFISLRVNDYHMVEYLDVPAGSKLPPFASLGLDRFRRERPDLRIAATAQDDSDGFKTRDLRVLDWRKPEVRARLLGFINEVCAYDIDGLELDFLRHFRLFPPGGTTRAERVSIVTGFVWEVRQILDRSERDGRHRWLCLRLPAVEKVREALGLDIPSLAVAGVEMFNLSSHYYTIQQDLDVAAVRAQARDATIYLEMTHVTAVGNDPDRKYGDADFYRRTTDEQFTTTAHLALARGADGVSLFNFAYYREYGGKPERGPFCEPPFHVIRQLADRAALGRLPQDYFLAPVWRSPYDIPLQLPMSLSPDRTRETTLDLAPPEGGWRGHGLLRVQAEKPFGAGQITARFNGIALQPAESVAEPYPSPYPQMLGTPATLRGWQVPVEILRDGINRITWTADAGIEARVIFVDLALPGK